MRAARRWLVLFVGLLSLAGISGELMSGQPGDFELLLVGLAVYAVAAVTVIRVPENRVSWVLLAIALGFSFGSLYWLPAGLGPALNFIGIFALILPGLGVLLPLWFPTGFAPTPRWRWVETLLWLALGGLVVATTIALIVGQANDDIEGCLSPHTCIEATSVLLVLLCMVAGVVALTIRWFRSRGLEHLQMKAVVIAFVVFAAGTVVEFVVQQDQPVGRILFDLGSLLIPVSIGAAIARYRLYEIDRIVSRTVTYAIVVGLLAAGVFGVATLAGSQFSEPLVVAATTLAVAALFNPLRKRIHSLVERRFNRSRYNAAQVMDEFVGTLREQVDPGEVVDGWVDVVNEIMQPSLSGVWVRRS